MKVWFGTKHSFIRLCAIIYAGQFQYQLIICNCSGCIHIEGSPSPVGLVHHLFVYLRSHTQLMKTTYHFASSALHAVRKESHLCTAGSMSTQPSNIPLKLNPKPYSQISHSTSQRMRLHADELERQVRMHRNNHADAQERITAMEAVVKQHEASISQYNKAAEALQVGPSGYAPPVADPTGACMALACPYIDMHILQNVPQSDSRALQLPITCSCGWGRLDLIPFCLASQGSMHQ